MSRFDSKTIHHVSLSSSVASGENRHPRLEQHRFEARHDIASWHADQWKNSTSKYDWKEVSRDFHELASTLKENLTPGTKVVKTVPKEKVTLADLAGQDEKQEDEERRDIKKLL